MAEQPGEKLPPHVLMFPFGILSHVSSTLKLANLLCRGGVHVTVLVSDHCHRRLSSHANLFSHPGFCIRTISDGLPEDHPRCGERVFEIMDPAITGPLFRELMISTDCLASDSRRPVSGMISDGVLGFPGDFALERGIPLIYFHTYSACSAWCYFCTSQLIQAADIPLKGNGMDLLVNSVPGMQGFLRRRDLPSFYRVDNLDNLGLQGLEAQSRRTLRAQAIIENTFEDIDATVLSHLRSHFPNVYAIGPLHSHFNIDTTFPASFWEEDRKCVTWLDSQQPKSVIYVSFGSVAVVTKAQMMEFWYGLVNSGQRFLWVMRQDSIAAEDGGESEIPAEILRGAEERGCVVDWAPQEEVLAHRATAGFLTHAGWNSVLESLVAGVPMICWPYFADQMTNSRYVSEVWKVGLDLKDTCDRVVIEKAVNDLMNPRSDEFQQRADQIADLARRAVSEGGSSHCDLNRLIGFIKSLIV